MKKAYLTPTLLIHGDVRTITSASADADRQDRIFNAAGVLAGTENGYLDQCFFVPDTYRCVMRE